MKNLFRYKYVSVLFIIIFSIGFVVFNYNMQAKLTKKFETEDILQNKYKYEATVLVAPVLSTYDSNIDYVTYLINSFAEIEDDEVNVFIIDIDARLNDYGVTTLADVYILGDEPKYPLVKGNYPENKSLDEKYIILGINRKKYTYKQNNLEFINVSNEQYTVTGYMSTLRSHYLDNEIIIYNSNFEGELWNYINNYLKMGMLQIVFLSDTNSNIEKIVNDFTNNIQDNSNGALESYVLSYKDNLKMTSSYVPPIKYKTWAWLSYFFSIVTTTFMCQYWMMCRKKEFAIKKIFGFSIFKIISQFLLETLYLMIIGVLFGIIFIVANNIFARGLGVFNIEIFSYVIGIVIGYVVISLIFVSIYPIIRLSRLKSVELINKKRS